jgi:hypothetical protein
MQREKVYLPKTITFPSGIVMVQDAFEPHRSYAVFPAAQKGWTEFFQTLIDNGEVGKSG